MSNAQQVINKTLSKYLSPALVNDASTELLGALPSIIAGMFSNGAAPAPAKRGARKAAEPSVKKIADGILRDLKTAPKASGGKKTLSEETKAKMAEAAAVRWAVRRRDANEAPKAGDAKLLAKYDAKANKAAKAAEKATAAAEKAAAKAATKAAPKPAKAGAKPKANHVNGTNVSASLPV